MDEGDLEAPNPNFGESLGVLKQFRNLFSTYLGLGVLRGVTTVSSSAITWAASAKVTRCFPGEGSRDLEPEREEIRGF